MKGVFLLKWWPTPYIKPIGNSIPVYTICGPGCEVLHKYGYVPPRRVWFSAVFAHYGLKLSMIFEEATHWINLFIFSTPNSSKWIQKKEKQTKYIIRTEFNEIFTLDKVIGSQNWVELLKTRSENRWGNCRVLDLKSGIRILENRLSHLHQEFSSAFLVVTSKWELTVNCRI